MSIFKKVTRKTGNNSKRTTTYSNKGTTQSFSSTSPSGLRRTNSFNSSTGRQRTTTSWTDGGGFVHVNSKTTGTSKVKRNSIGSSFKGLFWFLFWVTVLFIFLGKF